MKRVIIEQWMAGAEEDWRPLHMRPEITVVIKIVP